MTTAAAQQPDGYRGAEEPAAIHALNPMQGKSSRETRTSREARREFRIKRAIFHGLAGSIFGYVILHPTTMAVFAWFESGRGAGDLPTILDRMIESFSPGMLPMAVVFVVFSAVIGAMDGYYRSLIHFQRDDLARELATNELFQRELEVQNNTLRELELTKRRMTQFLVHDLKNHLGCVLGYSKMLLARSEKTGWGERDRDALAKINRQATQMAGEVHDVLDLAKLEHQPRFHSERVSAVSLLRNAVDGSALGPGEGEVRIDEHVQADIETVCNPGLIERVLTNLICNAVKHNGSDVVVTLGVKHYTAGIVYWCSDTGHGIDDDIRERLFDEFSSSSCEKRGSAPAYGLGLAFCRAAVKAHGGRIWLDTEPNKGTTFFFQIPNNQPAENGTTIGA